MSTDTNIPVPSDLWWAMVALHERLADIEVEADNCTDRGDVMHGTFGKWDEHEKLAQFFDADIYARGMPQEVA